MHNLKGFCLCCAAVLLTLGFALAMLFAIFAAPPWALLTIPGNCLAFCRCVDWIVPRLLDTAEQCR